jgi:hypothetical protein
MGFNSWTTHMILAANKEKAFRQGSPFGLGGRQSVFLTPNQIENLALLYGFSKESLTGLFDQSSIDTDTLRTRNSISDASYIKNLVGMETFSFDATDYENAGVILDLNKPFDDQLNQSQLNKFDGLFDGGCLDNVWNPAQSQMNLASLLDSGGRIINWVSASNWPGAFCMISCEWLLSFYAINGFKNIRVYWFHPISDGTNWPNLTAEVWRFNPNFTRRPNYDPYKAALQESSHPGFVLAVAEVTDKKLPKEWEMPMQSHYLGGDYKDWRKNYDHIEGLPFAFTPGSQGIIPKTTPIDSDHYEYCGILKGFI